jgi:hypothetical protein
MLRSWWNKYLIGKLMTIENFAYIVIDIEIMEFGLVLSSKSYTIPRETHSSSTITKSVKSLEKGKNMKFESKSN